MVGFTPSDLSITEAAAIGSRLRGWRVQLGMNEPRSQRLSGGAMKRRQQPDQFTGFREELSHAQILIELPVTPTEGGAVDHDANRKASGLEVGR